MKPQGISQYSTNQQKKKGISKWFNDEDNMDNNQKTKVGEKNKTPCVCLLFHFALGLIWCNYMVADRSQDSHK